MQISHKIIESKSLWGSLKFLELKLLCKTLQNYSKYTFEDIIQ